MKSKIILIACLLFSAILTSHAQVKIGDNPNAINPNSLLELESSTKGFLGPRVALNNINSPSPLVAPVPEGMLVYSDGGTLPDCYYLWNGTMWLKVITSASGRSNHILVKSAADLPAPVAGVINLVAGTVYEINGTITLTDKINLNGCTITGLDRMNDKLIYTPTTGELFTGTSGGNIFNVTISATGVGSKLFNVDAGNDPTKTLIIEFTYILNCDNIGLIKGFGGFVVIQSVGFSNNKNGFTFQDIGDFVGINLFWVADNQNTYQKFVGTFGTIHLTAGKMHVLSFFNAKAIDITGITSISVGAELKGTLFVGNGTYIVGTFSNAWEVESTGLSTQKDDVACGNLYLTVSATTVFSTVNVPVKALCTTIPAQLFRVTAPINNRLTYTGTKTRRFQVIGSLSVTSTAANKYFSFYIVKNGVVLPESRQAMRLSTGVDKGSVTLSCSVELASNDYIEVWAENNSDTSNMTVETLNLSIK